MIEYSDAVISNVIFHNISIEKHKSTLSDKAYSFEHGEEEEVLKKIFLKPFTTVAVTHEFTHHVDVDLNTLYKLSKDLYEGADFEEQSKDIYNHLQAVSKHQNIKDGELFILQLEDIQLNNKHYQALGIYKVENKDNFIETTSEKTGKPGLYFKKGIGSKKLDKACLILFTEDSYTVLIIDNASTETEYWKNEFINATLRNDHVNSTSHFLTIAKTFVTDQLPTEFEATRAHQAEYLNRSVEYFRNNDKFDKKEFEEAVFEDRELINSFRKFDKTYREDNELDLSDSFDISQQAVKKQQRIFKSIIKLDKNFHIYVHGNSALIEQGVEKDGRKFYKIYYQEEA